MESVCCFDAEVGCCFDAEVGGAISSLNDDHKPRLGDTDVCAGGISIIDRYLPSRQYGSPVRDDDIGDDR
jgi:hypothetical protein